MHQAVEDIGICEDIKKSFTDRNIVLDKTCISFKQQMQFILIQKSQIIKSQGRHLFKRLR